MKMFYYAIYDTQAEEFGPLFPAKNDKVAVRHFNQLIAGSVHPEDYFLKNMCEMDQETGQLGLPFEPYVVNTKEVSE